MPSPMIFMPSPTSPSRTWGVSYLQDAVSYTAAKENLEKEKKKEEKEREKRRKKNRCLSCNELLVKGSIVTLADGDRVCSHCFSQGGFQCDHCNQNFWMQPGEPCTHQSLLNHHIKKKQYCQLCWKKLRRQCSLCGQSFPLPLGVKCSKCGKFYCMECDWCGCEFKQNNRRIFYGEKRGQYLTIKRAVGIEIEVFGGMSDILHHHIPDRFAETGDDGSIRGSEPAIEIRTSPAALQKAERIIKRVTERLQEANFRVNKTCGLHVHIDAKDFQQDPIKLAYVLRTVYAAEDILFSMLPASRHNNQYCMALSRRYRFKDFQPPLTLNDFDNEWYRVVDPERIKAKKSVHGDRTRYCGLNLHSAAFRGTIEFRYHSGTRNFKKIISWITLLLKIVNYATKRYDDKEITELYKTKLSSEKLALFYQILKVPRGLQEYVNGRIRKFNPDFKKKKRFKTYKFRIDRYNRNGDGLLSAGEAREMVRSDSRLAREMERMERQREHQAEEQRTREQRDQEAENTLYFDEDPDEDGEDDVVMDELTL